MILISIAVFIGLIAQTVASVDSQDGGVQILKQRFTSSDGRNYRYDFEAYNGRNSPVYLTIYLTSSDNCYDGLITGNTLIGPGGTASLGSLQQSDGSKAWSFHYQWRWTDATNQ